jgi:hypothetical protein
MQLSFSNGSGGTPINLNLPSQYAGGGQGSPNISLSFSNPDDELSSTSNPSPMPPSRPPANQQTAINNLGRKLQLAKNLNDVQNRLIQSAQQDLQALRGGGSTPPSSGGGGRYTAIPNDRPNSRYTPISIDDDDMPPISMSNNRKVRNNIVFNINTDRYSSL